MTDAASRAEGTPPADDAAPQGGHAGGVGTPDLTATADALGGNANLPNRGHDPTAEDTVAIPGGAAPDLSPPP